MSMNKYATNYCKRFPLHLSNIHFLVKLKVMFCEYSNAEKSRSQQTAELYSQSKQFMATGGDKVCKNYFYILELKCNVVENVIEDGSQNFECTFALWYSTLNSCFIEILFFFG